MMKRLEQRADTFGEYILVRRIEDIGKPIQQCQFTHVYHNDTKSHYTSISSNCRHYNWICVNSKTKIKCNGSLILNITISPTGEFVPQFQPGKTPHLTSCSTRKHSFEMDIEDIFIDSEADNIVNNFSYFTPSEIKFYFGFDEKTLKLIMNKIKTKKKTIPYYSIELLLDTNHRYHLITPNSDENMIIFFQTWSFQIINSSSEYYIDGTFKCKIDGFYQLFVFTCALGENYFNVLLILLKDKKKETYNEMIVRINQAGQNDFKNFSFLIEEKSIMIDFEAGLIESLKEFKNFIVCFCDFHRKQAIQRYLFSLGFPKTKAVDRIDWGEEYSDQEIENDTARVGENIDSLRRMCSSMSVLESDTSFETSDSDDSSSDELNSSFEKELDSTFDDNLKAKTAILQLDQYKEQILRYFNISENNRTEMIKIVEYLQKNEIEITTISTSLGTRSLIKCLLNIGYLNSSFLNEILINAIFDEIFANVSKDYVEKLIEFKKYIKETWTGENALFKDWSIFNTSMTSNNISETTNAKIDSGLPNGKSISLPKFIAQVKLIFYTNQQRILKWNEGTLDPQKAPFTRFKNTLIILLNFKLFSNEIDVISYLILMVDVNKIEKKEERKAVLKKIIETCNSSIVYKRKLFLLSKNYEVEKTFSAEKKKFYDWLENEKKAGSVIGQFINIINVNPKDQIDFSSMLSDSGETDSYAIELAIDHRRNETIENAIKLFDEKPQQRTTVGVGEMNHVFEAVSFRKYTQIQKQRSKLGKKFNELIENTELTMIIPNGIQQGVDKIRIATVDKLSAVGEHLPTKRKQADMATQITEAVSSNLQNMLREEFKKFVAEQQISQKKEMEEENEETENEQRVKGFTREEMKSMIREVFQEQQEEQEKRKQRKRQPITYEYCEQEED